MTLTSDHKITNPDHIDHMADIDDTSLVYDDPFFSRGDHHRDHKFTNGLPRISNAAELMRRIFPPIKYVVPGYITEGCTILAGRPKLGKSWLMLDVGLAVAAGRFCLGETLCQQGAVLYLALEDNERRLQSRITKVLGAEENAPAAFNYATDWPRGAEGVKAIKVWLRQARNPRLVVVDVLAMFRQANFRDATLYEADYHAIKGLQQLAADYNVAIVVVTHTRKGGADTDPFEKVSGTLGLSGAADTVMVLDRDSNGATLYARGRDIEEIEAAIAFDKPTCRWTIEGNAADVRRSDERSSILTALDESDEPMKSSEISDATRMPNGNVRQLLVTMVKAGEVTKVKRGLYAHPDHNLSPDHNDHNDHNITNVGDDGEDHHDG